MYAASQPSLRPLAVTRAVLRHWLVIFLVVYGLFNALPFVAPLFMKLGWTGAGNAIYTTYSFLCHQMAQRSFFLFGEHVMYRPNQLPVALTGSTGADTLLLREFRGSDALGWKVAWSDRMISLYGGVWLAGLMYWGITRLRTAKPISLLGFGLLMLPLALDGGTHMISDNVEGLLTGFRYDNAWLAALTGYVLPESFYAGDALGSFNSWMRLITGMLAAVGVVWLAFPLTDREWRRSHTPMQAVELLAARNPQSAEADLRDVAAYLWTQDVSLETLLQAEALYNQNCAACHGQYGGGDGPAADTTAETPAAFAEAPYMFEMRSDVLYAKIRRGGMGTDMPNFGTLFTPEETWALVEYLWTLPVAEPPETP